MTTSVLSESRAAAVRHLLDHSALADCVWTEFAFELNGRELFIRTRWYDLNWSISERALARVVYGLADLESLGKFIDDAPALVDDRSRRAIAEALDLWLGAPVAEAVRS